MAKTSASGGWWLLYVLPNLNIRDPIETDDIAIVPPNDPRLQGIKHQSLDAKRLTENYSDHFKNLVEPAALLVRMSSVLRTPSGVYNLDAIVDYRNLVAICATAKGWSRHILSGRQSIRQPPFSEYFEFFPVTLARQPDYLHIHLPMKSTGLEESKDFHGQVGTQVIHFPNFPPEFDTELFDEIIPLWKRVHVRKRTSPHLRSLFRSLQIAFQAGYSPFGSVGALYGGIGVNLTLWVSAFEILVHPGRGGRADVGKVRQLLEAYDWKDTRIKHRRYKVGKGHRRVGVPAKLYSQLYDLRNDFAHGNPIRFSSLTPLRRGNSFSFMQVSPVLFRAALMRKSAEIKKRKLPKNPTLLQQLQMTALGDDTVNALLRVAGY